MLKKRTKRFSLYVLFVPFCSVAIHMHNKIGVWLPIFETGVIVKNQLLTAPNFHMKLTVNKTGYNLAFPVSKQDQQILDTRYNYNKYSLLYGVYLNY